MVKKRKPAKLINRKARFEYSVVESLEAGIVLAGEEVKAVRANQVDLTGSYVRIINNEAWWIGGVISVPSGDQQRTRKLLLHSEEIRRLLSKVEGKGLTIIPTGIYFKRGRAKLEIALSRGKKLYDKRSAIKAREQAIEARRELKKQI